MAGRRPNPTNLHVLRGNPSRLNLKEKAKREAQPVRKEPPIPKYLSKSARKIWRATAPGLVKLGLLTEVDGDAFAAYCSLKVQVARVERALEEPGFELLIWKCTVDGSGQEHKEPKQNPLITMHRQLLQSLRMYASEFGLTPSSRGRVRVPEVGESDPLEAFLKE